MEVKKKIKQLSRTQVGVSLTKEDREIIDVELGDIVSVKKEKKEQYTINAKGVQDGN